MARSLRLSTEPDAYDLQLDALQPEVSTGQGYLVHARTDEAAVAAATGMPVIYTASSRVQPANRRKHLESAFVEHRRHSAAGARVDVNLYSGKNRKTADADIDADFLNFQARLGASSITTDSGYVGQGNEVALTRLFEDGARKLGPYGDRGVLDVIVHSDFVSKYPEVLADLIRSYGIPVSLKVEHATDPFASRDAVRGLVLIGSTGVPTELLRTDIAAGGALAVGYRSVSIGTGSGLRHVYPSQGGGPSGNTVTFHVIHPQGLAFRTPERLSDAISLDPDNHHWVCVCDICYGRSIQRLALNEVDASRHSIEIIGAKLHQLLAQPAGTRRAQWADWCGHALAVNLEIKDLVTNWPNPSNLRAWQDVLTKG